MTESEQAQTPSRDDDGPPPVRESAALKMFGAVLVVAILAFATAARERNRTWQDDPVDRTILPRFLRSRLHANVGVGLFDLADAVFDAHRHGETPERIDRLWTEWEDAVSRAFRADDPDCARWLAIPRDRRGPRELYEPAETAFLRARHDLPTFQVAWHGLGLIDWERSRISPEPERHLARAVGHFATARRVLPQNRESFVFEAQARFRLGENDAAFRALEAALPLYRPNSERAVFVVETLLEAAAHLGDAERLEAALSRYPGHVPDVRRRFGHLAGVAINLAAEGRAREALSLLDHPAEITIGLASEGRTEEALSLLDWMGRNTGGIADPDTRAQILEWMAVAQAKIHRLTAAKTAPETNQ
jgi:tetratricopeptide (TPR) repeat protein